MKQRKNILKESFQALLLHAESEPITVQMVVETFAGKGQAMLLILFSLPFCLPISIPGVSTPFGLILMFIGFRIAFRHRVWLPKALLKKTVSVSTMQKIAKYTVAVTDSLRFLLTTRMRWLFHIPWLHVSYGLIIAILAILLALPLPLPFTNFLVATPILLFGLALLEEDGLVLLFAYLLSFCGMVGFGFLVYYGYLTLLAPAVSGQ